MKKYTEFSFRLKAARDRARLSKAEVARKTGVSPAYIGQLESMTEETKKNPSVPLVESLAQVLGVNSVWLNSGEGEMVPDKFRQLSAGRPEEIAEEKAINEVVSAVQSLYPPGSINLTLFEEALFYMMQDLPEEARRRVQKDIIMEWTSARRKSK